MVKCRTLILPILFASAFGYGAAAGQLREAADPWMGTWKLNLEKSKFNSGPPPKGNFVKLEPIAGGMKNTWEAVDPQGRVDRGVIEARFDGKEYAEGGAATRMTLVYRRIDRRSYEVIQKVDGKMINSVRSEVSDDGKTRTARTTWVKKDQSGQPIVDTWVYDRQ